ncbi:hypothetical protein [Bathymodiolus thermophilus thioautotrophic gill symbiont]|uniref:Uncharacterized protein n=1 Tax=Bathymodiolus thermophilus thioautotrophic gill symbiont TaxID=2360 RepID=A0A1J5U9T5_9GAMM|nr:hypothetical protein [Bathymodiolus thermophilus thioautotrophic gill symbiont]OIR25598.1 hypothetical protein BGC33_07185 [Bathymodiolus thermophilus thioautotrophic gill symbiont]
MSNIQTIVNIVNIINKIKERLKAVDCQSFLDQNFGRESEYTCKELYIELDEILTDITTLTEKPKQFLKLSSYRERNDILRLLNDINTWLKEPRDMESSLDPLKGLVRQFYIKYSNDRFVEFDSEITDLTGKKQIFSTKLEELEDTLNQTFENKKKSSDILENLQRQQEQLEKNIKVTESKEVELSERIANFNEESVHISDIKIQIDRHKEVIDNFVEKIVSREQELENQTKRTNDFNEKLKKFTTEKDTLLERAKSLIEEAKTALGYKKAEGISGAFKTQLDKRSGGGWWLVGAGSFAIIAISLTVWFVVVNQSVNLDTTLARISIIILPVTGAWFCAGQYTKLKNIAEDYAYKTILAQSIIGFSEQLKSNDEKDTSYQDYMKKMLDEIHQHPLKNHKKQDDVNPYVDLFNNMKGLAKKQ